MIRKVLLCVFILLSFFLPGSMALASQEGAQAVIFMYHRFGESRYPSTNITLQQFEEQLDFFENNNFTVLPLGEIVEALKQNKQLPDRSIAITIDDAYLSVYKEAYPRLKAKGYPFTVFVATGVVDQGIPAYMDWQQMKEMQQHGAMFANHSQNHDYLVRKKEGESQEAWRERMVSDITGAQKRLQEKLGEAPALYAYPYGEYNLELMKIVQGLGYSAFGQHSGGVSSLNNRAALPRFPVAEAYAEMSAFRTKAFSLAMPVITQEPIEPVTTEKRPQLTITLAPSSANLDQLACYFGNKKMKIRWLEPGKRFQIQAENDLPSGRSRYNCTAPDAMSGRYFWYSQPWLRQMSRE
jgi:poly-beta-1,6-N-acetyl-D-glucosamine N-deacetylase